MTDFEKWWTEQGEDLLEIGNIYEIARAAWNAANAALRAEIERKDKLIEEASSQLYADTDGLGSIAEARKLIEQALSPEEVSDENNSNDQKVGW